MKRISVWLAFIFLPVFVLGGMMLFNRNLERRNLEFPTQMALSPAYHSQTANPVLPGGLTAQPPVAGTIPRGFRPFRYDATPEDQARAGRELTNPLKPDAANLERGKYIYTNNCTVCHGAEGLGDGPVIPKFPNPPSYTTDASRALSDGELFHIITRGRNNMPALEAQVSAEDRWKVVLYIRTLQANKE